MFHIYVKLCDRVTVIRDCCTGCGRQSKKAGNTARADSSDAVCKYGVVADAHGYIARYATSRGATLGRILLYLVYLTYHAREHVRYASGRFRA